MNTPYFIKLVEQMRENQKTYFRTRKSDALDTARASEKAVDSAIKEMKSRQTNIQF